MTEQVIFTNEDGEDIRFYVVEETKIAGVNYLLVTEQEDADSEAYIMKKVAEDGNEELVCEFVEDEQELDAISKCICGTFRGRFYRNARIIHPR